MPKDAHGRPEGQVTRSAHAQGDCTGITVRDVESRPTARTTFSNQEESGMSHHLDTPLAAKSGQLYIDDLYVFPGAASTVLIMDVNSDVNGKHSEPGFHPEARYEFKVHFDGADVETLTYRVSFSEADQAGRQDLSLHAVTGDEAREDSAAGELILEGRT